MRCAIALSCVSLMCASAVLAKPPATADQPALQFQGGETPRQMREAIAHSLAALLPQMDRHDQAAFLKVEAIAHHAGRPGAEAERAACCQALADVLKSKASTAAKVWILRQLVFVGKADVVPVEAALLADHDPRLRETARAALEHNPAPAAATALRNALSTATEPAWQGALALALGARKDAASVPELGRLLGGKDPRAVGAALMALGDIGDAAAAAALAKLPASLPQNLRITAAEAHLKCAERLLAAGNAQSATAIYRQHMGDAPHSIRLAALAGLLRSSGDTAGDTVLSTLGGGDAQARAMAVSMIAELTPAALETVAAGYDKLPAGHRIAVLSALAARGEKAALPAALAAAKSEEPEVCMAGLTAVGQLGDASAVPLLVQTLLARGPAAAIARDALLRLAAADVNERLIGVLKAEKNGADRERLIDVLETRGAPQLVELLLPDVKANNARTRQRAMAVMGKLALPAQLPALLPGLLKSAAGSEREDAERALATVCARADPERRADLLLAAYRAAAPADRLLLLPALGRIGGPKVQATIQTALASSDAKQRDAAIRALCNWPNAAVANDLLQLAQHAEQDSQRLAALRALVRVAALRGSVSDKERLALLAQAIRLAQRDQERSLILQRASSIRNVQTLHLVVPYLENPALCPIAARTIVELAHAGGMKGRDKAEYQAALKKVISRAKDKGMVEAAGRELRGE